jgi:GntR family transcriptional repressor for pyruvate dehydrogenase complex
MAKPALKFKDPPIYLLSPIQRVTINQQILDRLKIFLEHSNLEIGSRLPSERQLAAMLKVSRPSLREVLRALSMLGITKSKQGDGTYLTASFRKLLQRPEQALALQESLDLVELAEARLAIEPTVAALTSFRASKEDLVRIRIELEGMRKNLKDATQFLKHDFQFHLGIAKACGNGVFSRVMSVVLEALFAHSSQVAQNYGDLSVICELHQEIFNALRQRDQSRAKAAMIRHMKVSRRENLKLGRSSESSRAQPVRTRGRKGTPTSVVW